jgi:hypothetical protein
MRPRSFSVISVLTEPLYRSNHKPLKARKNQNELLLENDTLIFYLQNEHLSSYSNFTWLHVDLQQVKVRSIALAVAFSEQMCQVASTETYIDFIANLLYYIGGTPWKTGEVLWKNWNRLLYVS